MDDDEQKLYFIRFIQISLMWISVCLGECRIPPRHTDIKNINNPISSSILAASIVEKKILVLHLRYFQRFSIVFHGYTTEVFKWLPQTRYSIGRFDTR